MAKKVESAEAARTAMPLLEEQRVLSHFALQFFKSEKGDY